MPFEAGTEYETVIRAVAISGSPSTRSKSRRLLEAAAASLGRHGVQVTAIDLSELPADALLGRARSAAVEDALAATAGARILVASTPVYRASYSGLLKVFFDLMKPDSLAGAVAVPIATGGGLAHQLVLDHTLRPLFASLGATVVPTGVYGTDAQFASGAPDSQLLDRLEKGVAEALAFSRAVHPFPSTSEP
jgi:FMN reductase